MAGNDDKGLVSGGRRARQFSVVRTKSPAARELIIRERLKEDPTLDPETGMPPDLSREAAGRKGKKPTDTPASPEELSLEEAFPIPKFVPNEIVELKKYTGLARLPEEDDRQYRSFLLYAMQDPDRRAQRAVWRALGRNCAESAIANWRKRYSWDERVVMEGSDSAAAVVYGKLYYRRFSMGEVQHLTDNLKQPFKAPNVGNEVPSKLEGLLDAEAKHAEQQSHKRAKLAGQIGDLVMRKIAKTVADDKYEAKLSDVNHVEMLYKVSAASRTSVTAATGNESRADLPHLSERVEQAKKTGDTRILLDALLEDTRELAVIMEVVAAQADADEKSGLAEVFKGSMTFVPPSKTGDTSSEVDVEVAKA